MRFQSQSGHKFASVVFLALFNAALCGGENKIKRFCNCAFDCLTEEGIEYHNVTLSGESARNGLSWQNEVFCISKERPF